MTRAPTVDQVTPAKKPRADKSASSCSDITGIGGSGGPGNCTSSTIAPENKKAQIDQATKSMQAGQTIKRSDPTYSGWTAAAVQFRKAAAGFKTAGDLAHAAAATEQAETLEAAIKIADQGNGALRQPAVPIVATQNNTGSVDASQDSANSFNIPTPCEDLTGKYGCGKQGDVQVSKEAKLTNGPTQRITKPKQWKPGGVAPDVQAEILALANSMLSVADNDPRRLRFKEALERRLADHRVPMNNSDLVCLQPVSGSDHPLIDIPLRWKPEHIKKEAIDRSHLCDGVDSGEAKDSCRESKYGEAVMWAEPELAGQCRLANAPTFEVDKVAECAKTRFLNAWANGKKGIVAAPTPATWVIPASCNATGSPDARRQSLRDLLRARLAAAGETNDDSATTSSEAQPPLAATPLAEQQVQAPLPPPETDDDEAYCNYMARQAIRGELTPGETTAIPPGCKNTMAAASAMKARLKADGDRPFSMSADETDAEIRRLVGAPHGQQMQ